MCLICPKVIRRCVGERRIKWTMFECVLHWNSTAVINILMVGCNLQWQYISGLHMQITIQCLKFSFTPISMVLVYKFYCYYKIKKADM